MAYLASTCTPAEIDAEITRRLADASNTYWTAAEVTAERNNAIQNLFPKFRLKATDVSLSTVTTTNIYTLPSGVTAVGDDAMVAMDIDNVVITDWTVWGGKLITPRQGNWSDTGTTIRIYYIKPFTSPPGVTLDVPGMLQPLVVARTCIALIDKKLMEANARLSSHWYALKRQWMQEADRLEASVESIQKEFMTSGEIKFDGGHTDVSGAQA